ncbi:MAG: DUF3857 domain-containing protein [Acidobacteria bacterium]|nr:DUF3857 domain-containing protein [Acidobacteriota bacterium]
MNKQNGERLIFSVLVWLLISASEVFANDPPAWLHQVAAAAPPASEQKAPALVLHHECRREIREDGRIITTIFYAVKVLTLEGRKAATANVVYNTDTEKVRKLEAWMLPPTGKPVSYGKNKILDVALADNDVYNEARLQRIEADDDSQPGCVFGYEAITEERSIFSQFLWHFQEDEPTLLSRASVTVPEGWSVSSVTFNHEPVEPVVRGATYTWELRNLPLIEHEPAGPGLSRLVPAVAVNISPPPNNSTILRPFAGWKDVSVFSSGLSDPQATYTDEMAGRARELTAGAKNEYERIQQVARYVQSINYISIQTGLGRGGGYRPHAAADIFAKHYGDCKDKANVMRALLKSLGIESYPVAIFSGDPNYVREEWPSPLQFNHCIIAVRVSDDTRAATIIQHQQLGRLLIFDPTDDATVFGDLPHHEQGSLALIIAGKAGGLMRMPVTSPAARHLEREIEAKLDSEGMLTARLTEKSGGQAAVKERRLLRQDTRSAYNRLIERWISSTAPGSKVQKLEPTDHTVDGHFTLDVEFETPAYAQSHLGKMLVFKPSIVSRKSTLLLTSSARKHPVVLNPEYFSEIVKIRLPAGFTVDDLPAPVELNRSFGNYALTCAAADGVLIFKRSLLLESATIPVDQYPAVRDFFERIRQAEVSPVVLVRE